MNIQKDLRRGFLDRMWAGKGQHGMWKHENTVWADGSDLASKNRASSRESRLSKNSDWTPVYREPRAHAGLSEEEEKAIQGHCR